MIISDLDHLKAIDNNNETKELSGGYYNYLSFSLDSYVYIDGNRATADSSASAYGDDTFTRASAYTNTDDYYSYSSASADSATDDYYYYY